MTEFEGKVLVEAKRLCLAWCRAAYCVDSGVCRSGAEGPFWLYMEEARERVLASLMDAA